ncbi:MAG: hypothetical protein ACT4N2_10410, partial [Hyphomicrobium sp.]
MTARNIITASVLSLGATMLPMISATTASAGPCFINTKGVEVCVREKGDLGNTNVDRKKCIAPFCVPDGTFEKSNTIKPVDLAKGD